jgi:hypothetical protein
MRVGSIGRPARSGGLHGVGDDRHDDKDESRPEHEVCQPAGTAWHLAQQSGEAAREGQQRDAK